MVLNLLSFVGVGPDDPSYRHFWTISLARWEGRFGGRVIKEIYQIKSNTQRPGSRRNFIHLFSVQNGIKIKMKKRVHQQFSFLPSHQGTKMSKTDNWIVVLFSSVCLPLWWKTWAQFSACECVEKGPVVRTNLFFSVINWKLQATNDRIKMLTKIFDSRIVLFERTKGKNRRDCTVLHNLIKKNVRPIIMSCWR